MKTILVGLLFSLPYEFHFGNGHLILESGKYIPIYDTTSGGGDDLFWVQVQERNAYICAKSDSAVTMVNKGWFVQGRDTFKLETIGLYNLDSDHNYLQYVKYRKIGNREYLFARMGPRTCSYYVAWKKEGRIFKRKETIEPVIEFDPYKDEKYLDDWLKSVIK